MAVASAGPYAIMHLTPDSMGVNATGTLAGSQVDRRRRENRGAVYRRRGGRVCGGAVALPRKIVNFFYFKMV